MRRHSHARTAGWHWNSPDFRFHCCRPDQCWQKFCFFFVRKCLTYFTWIQQNIQKDILRSSQALHSKLAGNTADHTGLILDLGRRRSPGSRATSPPGSAAMVTMHDGPRRTSFAGLFGKVDSIVGISRRNANVPRGRTAFVRVWEEAGAIARVFGSCGAEPDENKTKQQQKKTKQFQTRAPGMSRHDTTRVYRVRKSGMCGSSQQQY